MADGAPLSMVHARVVHQIPGRTRLRLAEAPAHARLVRLADDLAAAGIDKIEIRPGTGSIILTHTAPWAELDGPLSDCGLVCAPQVQETPPKPPMEEAGERIAKADLMVTLFSGGRIDLPNAAFLGLMVGGLVQLARGRVAGPALTLFGQALTLAVLKDRERPPL